METQFKQATDPFKVRNKKQFEQEIFPMLSQSSNVSINVTKEGYILYSSNTALDSAPYIDEVGGSTEIDLIQVVLGHMYEDAILTVKEITYSADGYINAIATAFSKDDFVSVSLDYINTIAAETFE